MIQSALAYRFCYKQLDQQALINFLNKRRGELYMPDRAAVRHNRTLSAQQNAQHAAGLAPVQIKLGRTID